MDKNVGLEVEEEDRRGGECMEQHFELIVVGGGPGGYVAAIKAAKLGITTALIEEHRVGGTCLNRGCIPAKAMIHAAAVYQQAKHGETFGVLADEVRYDYDKILKYKEDTTDQLVQGVEQLLKANNVTRISGRGRLLPDRKVEVTSGEEKQIYEADKILLATGSKPIVLPIPGMELPGVLTSDELFALREAPKSMVIIGGGVISVELATAFADLDCKITILEAMPRLVPGLAKDVSQNLKMLLKKKGMEIHTSAAVQSVEQTENGYACRYVEKDKEQIAEGQYILCAVGRKPNTDGLFAEGVQPELERDRVVVDDKFRTSLEGVYAIGDLIKGLQLAHLASAQGVVVAEILAGQEPTIDLHVVPSCVYTEPELASVGYTEDQAKEEGIPVAVGKFIMTANGKSLIEREERGFIKVVAHQETGVILGCQMMCARATDMIGEMVTAIAAKLTVHEMQRAMRPHPTCNEGLGEALEELTGGAIHIMPKKKL